MAERHDRQAHLAPTVTVYDSWRVPFAELARENGFTPEDIDEAVVILAALIAAIDASL